MKEEIRGIPDPLRSEYIPLIFADKFGHVSSVRTFYTDGSKTNDSTGFGVYNEFHSASHKLQSPCSVYVAELAAIHYALERIASLPSNQYFIFTDSLSSIEAIRSMRPIKHSSYFLREIRSILRALLNHTVTLVWVPSHCSIPGNEKADSLAKVGAMQGDIYERRITFDEFFSIARQQVMISWQQKWNEGELGRWLHSILPQVSNRPWFKGLDMSRDFIKVMCRLMSNHYSLGSHLFRIGLAGSNRCGCGDGYQDINHVVWYCREYEIARTDLCASLRARGKPEKEDIRDVLGRLDFDYMFLVFKFLKKIDVFV